MSPSTAYQLLGTLANVIHLLLIGTPDNALFTRILLWLVRIITFSLLLRTYLGPWLLSLMSDHIRVRSISLWSIRGLYIRKGSRVWRVERVSYAWSSVQGSRRLALKIDGLNVHITKEEEGQAFSQTQRRRIRKLTLADLNPSPLARYLWKLTSALTTFLEPYLRPIIRTYVVACLRIGIQWLPRITQALSFDLQSTVITLADMPGTKIVAHEINLHTALALTQLEQAVGTEDVKPTSNHSHKRKSLSMGLWKKRLAESFHRSLDKAWGETRGTATLSLTIGNVIGTMPSLSLQESQNVPFLLSPGSIDLRISAKFNPREGMVDPHGLEVSLKIGDCSVNIDLLKLLLEKLPKRPRIPPTINPPEPMSPMSIQSDTPLASSFSPGSQPSTTFPSPVQSFTSALFSPSSLLFSPSSILSPSLLSPNLPQPFSPTSPFFKALSASIRPRRRYLVQPYVKLKDVKNVSQLSILHSIRVNVASICLSLLTNTETGPYKTLVKDVVVDFSLSDHDHNWLHRKHLGCRTKTDTYDPDAYSLKLTLHQVTVERETQYHTMRLARLDSFDFIALACQWPSPFLVPGPFMRDANTPILALHTRVAGVQIAERIQDLQRMIALIGATQKAHDKSHTPSTSLSIPRLIIGLESGPIGARIIYDADKGEKHRALELRNNGFVVSLDSEYKHPSLAIARTFPWASSVQSLHWNCTLSILLEPVLIRVRSTQKGIAFEGETLLTSDKDFLDDPPILSVGTVEVNVAANAVAQTDSVAESLTVIDKSTLVYELSAAFDTICAELWHPISVDAILQLLSIIPPKTKMPDTFVEAQPRFTRLPAGLSAKIAVAHFVVYITSPVISPGENLDLSRGFAMRTSISLEYCSFHASHDHWFDNPKQMQSRAKLLLPAEPMVDALVAAKTTVPPNEKPAFVKVRVVNLAFRTAVATPYEPDEPAIVGRDDLTDGHQEFLRIHHIHFDLCLSCKSLSPHRRPTDICDISVQIPSIRADLELAHAYSVLLGLQTCRILSPPRPPQPPSRISEAKSNIQFMLQGNITTIQVHLALPNQKLLARIDRLSPSMDSSGPPKIRITKTAVFVSLPPQIHRWEEPTEARWDEFIALQAWEICLAPHDGSLSISITGDSARLRIPCGFVLADLVQDAVVSLKAVRHISHMASAGCYSAMPSPEPEGPKSVPHITLRLECLCLEAQDDPFESKLALIWQAGAEAVKQRLDREDAFKAKVATILTVAPDLQTTEPKAEHEYQFSARHTVSIEEARKRLDDVHTLDWTLRLERLKEQRSKEEGAIMHKTHSPPISSMSSDLNSMPSQPQAPPLLRVTLHNLSLTISPPSFSIDRLPDIMHDFGSGLPRDTKFSLLIPLHIHFTLSSLQVNLRDYPLPLFSVPLRGKSREVSWTFNTDLIVGEEMGSQLSVDWIDCPIIQPRQALHGEAPFSIAVPKTIMPVKTYAAPIIEVTTARPTILSWGVSYGPAIQDMMRVVETLSSSPRDSSPAVGFWDKIRLVFHWTVKVSFIGDVRLYMKGTRDPYNTLDSGAGFVLCWQGSPEIRVGYENPQKELIQVISEGMLIAVPNLEHFAAKGRSSSGPIVSRQKKPFQKVCAHLSSGVRYGAGFVVERSCGPDCLHCDGVVFHRKCRFFSFRPHYNVILEKKLSVPDIKGPHDSYSGFRSDFIHLSVSLTSSTKIKELKGSAKPSSLHLTPRLFAHFWSWCSLFDGALSLPIRQGSYHPSRPISPKLGRHLATLKYRISLPNLYLMHGYIDNSRETWVDGVTPWVGVKGRVEEFQADMHQREEESTAAGPIPNTTRVIRRKPFYAAEVIMKGIELRAMLATFSEPLKQVVQITASAQRSNYRKHADLPITTPTSTWYDLEDFVELDWLSSNSPILHLLPLATFPHFTYFKRNSSLPGVFPQTSKFGSEHSHICLLGKEPSVPQTQISLASARATELKKTLQSETTPRGQTPSSRSSTKKMLALLEEYIAALRETEVKLDDPQTKEPQTYHMPTDIVSADEWAEFDNVYQIHCPSVFMDGAIRDIMMQYYYCSRERRGFEYHMANRAVKFIRDQANAALAVQKEEERVKDRGPGYPAQMAATALRKTYAILKGDNSTKISVDLAPERSSQVPGKIDPLNGWAEGVSLRKSDCCLLLKPQIVLRGESPADSCIVAATQAKLQSFAIMDDFNLDDPVSGKVMSRNYTSLSGLQTFAPTNLSAASDGPVPLEVLIDLRCESHAFERLVPQTEATFHYDKFNRLRLRNNITSITTKPSNQTSTTAKNSHLQDQTDVIRVHIPRFTVSANAEHFQAISNIVTKLLLFSDPAHKTRLDKLETLVFAYDFTDLGSAASVVSNLQSRLRDALETERLSMKNPRRLEDEDARLSLLHLRAHMFLLAEELNLLFDAIKMAQDRSAHQTDQNSALLLHASSSEISWRMLDERRNLLSKLVVTNINFHWLSRQDSSTVNHLTIGNLTALDGSRYAWWAEILSKYDEPANHPLLKRGLFLLANWTVLAPVGGITIYEAFELSLHPLRLQVDSKVGRRIMEYVWPDRKDRQAALDDTPAKGKTPKPPPDIEIKSPASGRSSIDSPRALRRPADSNENTLISPLRKLGSSRSFTDLRLAKDAGFLSPLNTPTFLGPPSFLQRTHSSDSINVVSMLDAPETQRSNSGLESDVSDSKLKGKDAGDAQIMKTRSSQKSFVLVRISSLHLLLSVVKEGSFECHDARIKTRELEYRNQTWSFEELVNQFIPSNMSWRGWVKMALNQPLVPVLPVARELLSKTKWTASKTGNQPHDHPLRLLHPSILATDDDSRLNWLHGKTLKTIEGSSKHERRDPLETTKDSPVFTETPLTAEPEPIDLEPQGSDSRPTSRKRVKSLFSKSSRYSSKGRKTDKRQSEDVKGGN